MCLYVTVRGSTSIQPVAMNVWSFVKVFNFMKLILWFIIKGLASAKAGIRLSLLETTTILIALPTVPDYRKTSGRSTQEIIIVIRSVRPPRPIAF